VVDVGGVVVAAAGFAGAAAVVVVAGVEALGAAEPGPVAATPAADGAELLFDELLEPQPLSKVARHTS
jgi:hypothetical protein